MVGHLHYLWWWAIDFAENGDLSGIDPADIAEESLWDGDPGEFLSVLMRTGFLTSELHINDWDEYTGRLRGGRESYKEANRIRQQRHRERHRNSDVTDTSNVTVTLRNGPTVQYSTEPNSTEPQKGRADATPTPPKKRATRIPADFAITDELRTWAIERGMSPLDVERRTETFTNYWTGESGAKASKLDWVAAWRVWMSRDFPGAVPRNGSINGHTGGKSNGTLTDAERRREELRQWAYGEDAVDPTEDVIDVKGMAR